MDILSARKKATERARAENKVEAGLPSPARPVPAEEPPRMEASVQSSPAAEIQRSMVEDAAVKAPASESAPAPEGTDEEIQAQEIEMLSFLLGGEEYVLPVDEVREVLKSRELTIVPNSPPHVLGVTSIRGTVLPVIDLGRRLGLPSAKQDEKARIIIINPDDEDAGIVVDQVTGVVRISPDAIRPAPETVEQGAEFLKGIARKGDRLYILLDLNKAAGS
ncbi:MAG TPA: chemotaxis protein CheW [Nitrospirota bacterium]|nr:chemotaxis protein CheW [Nitrospirota bacterium]